MASDSVSMQLLFFGGFFKDRALWNIGLLLQNILNSRFFCEDLSYKENIQTVYFMTFIILIRT